MKERRIQGGEFMPPKVEQDGSGRWIFRKKDLEMGQFI